MAIMVSGGLRRSPARPDRGPGTGRRPGCVRVWCQLEDDAAAVAANKKRNADTY
jgi:hypothetical protein